MNPKETSTIELYLDDLLPADERKAFEQELENDEQLREEVALQRAIRQTVLEFGPGFEEDLLQGIDLEVKDKALREQFQQQGKRLANQAAATSGQTAQIRRLIPRRRLMAIAAGFLLLLSAGSFWWANAAYSDNALAGAYYLDPDTPGTLSGSPDSGPDLSSILQLIFNEKDYEQAQTALLAIGPGRPEYLQAQYFLGHTYFQQKEFDAAVDAYTRVLAAPGLPAYINRDKVRWNLLLAKIGAGQRDADFQQQLDDLAENGEPPFGENARQLQKDLQSFWNRISF